MIEHVLFLRHFVTQQNVEKQISGRSLDIPILGSCEITSNYSVDHVLCSPAIRCRQTLGVFLENHPVRDIQYIPELTERCMGVLEGSPRSMMAEKYPELFEKGKFRLFETPPEGESFDEFYFRVKSFWEKYRMLLDGTVLICSHNQFLKLLYFIILDIPVTEAQWRKINFTNGVIERIM